MARVLIAEDDMAVREFVSRALIHGGHDVQSVTDGLEALEALYDETFDLLLTDISQSSNEPRMIQQISNR